MAQDMPPIPYQASMLNEAGLPTNIWADWFNKLLARIGGSLGQSGDWTSSLGPSGYQKLPGGLILQWGVSSSLLSGTNSTITFPTAFQSACYAVIPGISGNAAGSTAATGQYGVSSATTTGFSLNNRTSAAYTFYWVAVGV